MDGTQKGWTIRQSAAMAKICDIVVGSDSVFIHLASAFGIPAIGIFGPFSGNDYMLGMDGWVYQGRLACSPCGWHGRGRLLPDDKPCSTLGWCPAIGMIEPEEIVRRTKQILAEHGHKS
jgi:ADP-heptose:LPS heptosyltransferase